MNRPSSASSSAAARMGPHDGVARQVVGQVGQPAAVQQPALVRRRVGQRQRHPDPRHDPAGADRASAASPPRARSSARSPSTTTTPRARPAPGSDGITIGIDDGRLLVALVRRLEVQDRADRLAGDDAAGGEAAPVADPVDLVAHRLGGVAAPDVVRPQACGRRARRRRCWTPRAAPERRSGRRRGRPTDSWGRSRRRCRRHGARDRTRPESMNRATISNRVRLHGNQARPKGPMTEEHKAALARGRSEGKAVRDYLDALRANKPKRGRKRTPDSIKKRLVVDRRAS